MKPAILNNPVISKGTAFSMADRKRYGLVGLLPAAVETLEQQVVRSYVQYHQCKTNMDKYRYLDSLHLNNAVLYFRLFNEHLAEMLPIVYAPTVGTAIKEWSHNYRKSQAVYLSVDRIEDVRESFENLNLGPDDIDLIILTDAEAILGIGDWGVNGIEIAVAKLAVYTAAGGINPARTLAVSLDVGTDNEALLKDPLYLGNRHPRVRGERYDMLINEYLKVVNELFPKALSHFEDFGLNNARRLLLANRDKYLVFNDDMQGSGAVALAGMMAALKVTGESFAEQRLVIYGAGTSGTGVADQIRTAMERAGLTREQANERIWLIDINGLVTDDMPNLPYYQQGYARPAKEVTKYAREADGRIGLLEVVKQVKPTMLVGMSSHAGAFTEAVVREMSKHVARPIIFPLSNPNEKAEVLPANAIEWSDGRALVATGSPFPPVEYKGVTYHIGQDNNAFVFPGLGQGTIVSGATAVTDNMLYAAAEAVASQVSMDKVGASLLPSVDVLRGVSILVATAVAEQAVADGVATKTSENWRETVENAMWQPVYKNA